jgi:hypothetical protein
MPALVMETRGARVEFLREATEARLRCELLAVWGGRVSLARGREISKTSPGRRGIYSALTLLRGAWPSTL